MTTLLRIHCPGLCLLLAVWLGIHGHALAERKAAARRAERALPSPGRAKTAPAPAALLEDPPSKAAPKAQPKARAATDEPSRPAPWFRPKPSLEADAEHDLGVDPVEPLPAYRCKTATEVQCRDTNANMCSSQASELRERLRRYGKLANPASIGMSVPVLASPLPRAHTEAVRTSTLLVAVAPSAIGLKWRVTW